MTYKMASNEDFTVVLSSSGQVSFPQVSAGISATIATQEYVDSAASALSSQIDAESPLLARSFAIQQQVGWTYDRANEQTMYFRPRYFGMNDGDLFKGIIVRTKDVNLTPFPIVYMRLKRYSDGSVLGISEAVEYPNTANTDVVFKLTQSVALPSKDNYYMIDFATTPDGPAITQFGMRIYVVSGGTNPDCYFQLSNIVPVMTVQFYSFAEVVAPSASTELGQLADAYETKLELNAISSSISSNYYTKGETDEAIERVAAYYITYNANGDAFPTASSLVDATAYYSGGQLRVPTRNDYAVVLSDETHDNAEWRYIYAMPDGQMIGQWEAQYPIETNDYEALSHKPSVNGVTLTGNKTASDLSIATIQNVKDVLDVAYRAEYAATDALNVSREALLSAEAAYVVAIDAQATAGNAALLADSAYTQANSAEHTAYEATLSAQNALDAANDASGYAYRAYDTAQNALNVANIAANKAQVALDAAASAITSANSYTDGVVSSYLPLSGGTITGDLIFDNGIGDSQVLIKDADGYPLRIDAQGIRVGKWNDNEDRYDYYQINWPDAPDNGTLALAAPTVSAVGNLASLDANGNPMDSGVKASDYLPRSGGTVTGNLTAYNLISQTRSVSIGGEVAGAKFIVQGATDEHYIQFANQSGKFGVFTKNGANDTGTFYAFANLAPLSSPALSGIPTAPDIDLGTSSQIATKNYVVTQLSSKADIALSIDKWTMAFNNDPDTILYEFTQKQIVESQTRWYTADGKDYIAIWPNMGEYLFGSTVFVDEDGDIIWDSLDSPTQAQGTIGPYICNHLEDSKSVVYSDVPLAKMLDIANSFLSSTSYSYGELVLKDDALYICTNLSGHSGEWNGSDFVEANAMSAIAMKQDKLNAQQLLDISSISSKADAGDVVDLSGQQEIYGEKIFLSAVTIGSRHAMSTHGQYSLANGILASAEGQYSHAEGDNTAAVAYGSHVEGSNTGSYGIGSHAEGQYTRTFGQYSHADGYKAVTAKSGSSSSDVQEPHNYSYVWQGHNQSAEEQDYYHSHGHGTFNINPRPISGDVDVASGFYIGETSLKTRLDSKASIEFVQNEKRYSYASPEVTYSTTTDADDTATVAQLTDRASNEVSLSASAATAAFTLPPLVEGRMRDFFLLLEVQSADAPAITFTDPAVSGSDIEADGMVMFGEESLANIKLGSNLVMFTEIGAPVESNGAVTATKWLVSVKHKDPANG